MKFVSLGEQKSDDPQDEDPLQDQVVGRSLRTGSQNENIGQY